MIEQHMSYDGLRGQIIPQGLGPKNVCLEAGEKIIINDVNLEPEKLQDYSKDQDKELTDVDLAEQGREA